MKSVFRILLVLVTLAFTACGVSPLSCCGEGLSSEKISGCQIVTSDCETVSVLKSTDEDRHFYEDLTTMFLSQAENVVSSPRVPSLVCRERPGGARTLAERLSRVICVRGGKFMPLSALSTYFRSAGLFPTGKYSFSHFFIGLRKYRS